MKTLNQIIFENTSLEESRQAHPDVQAARKSIEAAGFERHPKLSTSTADHYVHPNTGYKHDAGYYGPTGRVRRGHIVLSHPKVKGQPTVAHDFFQDKTLRAGEDLDKHLSTHYGK